MLIRWDSGRGLIGGLWEPVVPRRSAWNAFEEHRTVSSRTARRVCIAELHQGVLGIVQTKFHNLETRRNILKSPLELGSAWMLRRKGHSYKMDIPKISARIKWAQSVGSRSISSIVKFIQRGDRLKF